MVLELLSELLKVLIQAIVVEIFLQIFGVIIQSADSCSQALRGLTHFILHAIYLGLKLLVLLHEESKVEVLICGLEALSDFVLCLLELIFDNVTVATTTIFSLERSSICA